MRTRIGKGSVLVLTLVLLSLAPQARVATADDLTGSSRFLCTPVQATVCVEDGECTVDLPWNVNIPQFIDVDLEARQLSTTAASAENRTTPIASLIRADGNIVFHGYEMGRAFSWVIDEQSGIVTVVIATDGLAVAIFGACTPMVDTTEPGAK